LYPPFVALVYVVTLAKIPRLQGCNCGGDIKGANANESSVRHDMVITMMYVSSFEILGLKPRLALTLSMIYSLKKSSVQQTHKTSLKCTGIFFNQQEEKASNNPNHLQPQEISIDNAAATDFCPNSQAIRFLLSIQKRAVLPAQKWTRRKHGMILRS
jgi:hypothetical protein